MKLKNDYRNLEFGWSGGFSEPYCVFLDYFSRVSNTTIQLNSYKNKKMIKICDKINEKKLKSKFILEAINKLILPCKVSQENERKFVCDVINSKENIISNYKQIIKKEITKTFLNFKSKTLFEIKKIINSFNEKCLARKIEKIIDDLKIEKKLDNLLNDLLEEKDNKYTLNFIVEDINEYIRKNIYDNTISIKEIIDTDKIDQKCIEEKTEKFIDKIKEIINFNPIIDALNLVLYDEDDDIIDFFSQLLCIEIVGSDGLKSDKNVVVGALEILNNNLNLDI